MADFSFNPALTSDLDIVRFWLSDTDQKTHYLADATITALLASEGDVGHAVMAGFDFMSAYATRPDVQTVSTESGGLNISTASILDGIEAARKRASKRFGIALRTTTTVNVYRADSKQTSEPDYANGTNGSQVTGRLVWEDD